jgi:hypothetical protein
MASPKIAYSFPAKVSHAADALQAIRSLVVLATKQTYISQNILCFSLIAASMLQVPNCRTSFCRYVASSVWNFNKRATRAALRSCPFKIE